MTAMTVKKHLHNYTEGEKKIDLKKKKKKTVSFPTKSVRARVNIAIGDPLMTQPDRERGSVGLGSAFSPPPFTWPRSLTVGKVQIPFALGFELWR